MKIMKFSAIFLETKSIAWNWHCSSAFRWSCRWLLLEQWIPWWVSMRPTRQGICISFWGDGRWGSWVNLDEPTLGHWERFWLVGVTVPRWPAFWGDSWCFSQRRVSPVLCLSSTGTCICPANMETLRCLKSAGPQNFPKGLNSISDIFRMTYISCFQTYAKMAGVLSRPLNLIGGLEHEFYFFHNICDKHPNWRIHIFQRGRYTTNQCYIYLAVSPSFWVKRTQFIDGFSASEGLKPPTSNG